MNRKLLVGHKPLGHYVLSIYSMIFRNDFQDRDRHIQINSIFYIDSYFKVLASIYLKINDELTTSYLNNYLKCKNLMQKLINDLTNEKEARQ